MINLLQKLEALPLLSLNNFAGIVATHRFTLHGLCPVFRIRVYAAAITESYGI